MVESAAAVGRKIEDEDAAAAATRAIVGAVPGACVTYWLVGSGATGIPLEHGPDHAACVQKDLARREGPGASYGAGTFRALEGALALWRETERALRVGLPAAHPRAKGVLEKKLAVIEAATRRVETRKVDATVPIAVLTQMGEAHAQAGVAIFKIKDAGADGDASPAR
jgi:hypothetical protein